MMGRLLTLPLLVLLLGFAGLAMLLPAGHAVVMRDFGLARAFAYMAILVLILAGMLGLAQANAQPRNIARNHLQSLALAYVILPPVLALPLVQTAAGGADFASATFEMVSAFTTTGAVVLDGPLKPSVQLWRALVGWLGGLFSLIMVFSVLAPLNLGGVEVETGRSPGRASAATQQITRVADPMRRMAHYATSLFPVYTGLTLVLWVLMAVAGEDGFVALCHAMGVMSTSGITPLPGGLASGQGGWLSEGFIAVFLLLALSRRPLMRILGQSRKFRLRQDPELMLAAMILLSATAGLFLLNLLAALWSGQGSPLAQALGALWGLFFTLLSFLTTMGYVSSHWAGLPLWSGMAAPDMVLWALAIIGGGVACTAGGVKLLRVFALLRFGEQELERVIHPNAIAGNRGGNGQSRAAMMQGTALAWLFFMLFALSIAACQAALTLMGLPFDTAIVLTLSALTTTGPMADHSAGIAADFAGLPGLAQIILGTAMVVGRLEILAILAILLPENLRK